MDDGFGIAVFVFVVWAWFILMVALLTSIDDPYCPVGQATILDEHSNVTGCVILPPVAPPGFVLAPGTPAPPAVAIVPPLYK